jgi:apolipoprotein D and lipocalin family protein
MNVPPSTKVLLMGLLALLGGCRSSLPPISNEAQVDIPRFMGDWYVIANIPTSLERGAHNAVESYRLEPDGSIATTFTFRDGAFDGDLKRYCPRGFVTDDPSKAIWGMQFVWPFKSDYRIVYVSPDYQRTIVGRQKRDNVWIMARTPQISAAELEELRQRVARESYDSGQLLMVPQQWPESASAPARSAEEPCS